MPSQVLISHPNWFRLMKGSFSINVKVEKFEFAMEFTKHVMQRLDENPVFQQKLWDAATKEWKAMLAALNKAVVTLDRAIKEAARDMSPTEFEKEKQSCLTEADGTFEAIMTRHRAQMAKAVDAEWAKIRKQNNLANTFKIKTVFKAIGRTVAITSSVLSLVASGGLNFLAYFTLARSIASSVSELKTLSTDLDKLGKQIGSDIKSFGDSLKKHPKLSKGKDVANTLTFVLLGTTVVNSYTAINKKLQVYNARIAILQQKQMKMGKEVKKLIDKVGKEKSKADKASQTKMTKLEKALNILLVKTAAMGKRFADNESLAVSFAASLKKLTSAKGRAILAITTGAVNIAANITKVVVSAAVLDAASASEAVVAIAQSLSKDSG